VTVRNGMSGASRVLILSPRVKIEELRLMLLDDLPACHLVKVFLGASEFHSGCCADVGISANCELTVLYFASASLAMEVVRQDCSEQRLITALTLLANLGDLQAQQSQILLDMLLAGGRIIEDGLTDVYGLPSTLRPHSDDALIKLAECFGRTCITEVFVPKLFDKNVNTMSDPQRMVFIVVLHEIIISRGPEVLPREQVIALFPRMFERLHDWAASPGDYYRGGPLVERAFVATYRLAAEFGDASVFPWAKCAEALEFDVDLCFGVLPQAPSCTLPQTGQVSSSAAVTSDDLETETTLEMEEALHQSEAEALQQEQEQVTEAVLRSKVDGMPMSADDVMVFRLTNFSKRIGETLRTSPQLAACRHRVEEAGCKVHPSFSPATFLVPVTIEHFSELDLSLQVHHILALRGDSTHIIEALKTARAIDQSCVMRTMHSWHHSTLRTYQWIPHLRSTVTFRRWGMKWPETAQSQRCQFLMKLT
jgi:hypothetical protein